MTVETSVQLTLKILQEKATRLRIDSVRCDDRSGQRPPDELRLRSGDHVGALLLRDALRSPRST